MFIERLEFDNSKAYSAIESAIHMGRYQAVRELCKGKRVLDIACGEGYGSYAMAHYWGAEEVIGVDISQKAIESAKLHFSASNITFICGEADEVMSGWAADRFDLIVSFETIEHIEKSQQFLQELKRLSTPNGMIFISCPNDHWYYPSPEQSNPYHIRKYTFDEFKMLTENILGSSTNYMLGLPISGFCNIDLNSNLINEEDKSMVTMFEMDQEPISLLLPATVNPTPENCSYFLGVWNYGEDKQVKNSLSVHPTSMDHTDYKAVLYLRGEVERLQSASNLENKNNLHSQELLKDATEQSKHLTSSLLEHQDKIKQLESDIEHLIRVNETKTKELETILSSKSWKITSPLRKIMRNLK
ncbi:class I SAM-dependent methyltransferase [Paenibacillus hunanensis]|uniref:SAM-dependent methyltransferase n=1 Tax=Paenibacillus hunanensis TaxID=539262 RepID=A0ABU1ITL6_9BACL|nr:class I SAM-dependent methyltransferase [Paenibacillus hunanensis]MDR6242556.1 SAM-dependent methyltransferase [Paenibacillus hunanensis]GGJ00956.1 hypothetical protein GCM10008022_07330 [Paenibacillus hunanensis]